jgi:predicted nuclease with TOPRIM domain
MASWLDWLTELPLSKVQQERIAFAREQFDALTLKHADAEKQIATLTTQAATITKENEDLKARVKVLEPENEGLRLDLEKANEEYHILQEKQQNLSQGTPTFSELQVQILRFLDSHPNSSIAAIAQGVGLTTSDLKPQIQRLLDAEFIATFGGGPLVKPGSQTYKLTKTGRAKIDSLP